MIIPDPLAQAREALAKRSSARNIFVLPAGAFADFRLDGPPEEKILADAGDDFFLFTKNNRLYARMLLPWYEAFSSAWNTLSFSLADQAQDPDAYLCLRILQIPITVQPVAKEDFDLIRRCMDLPHLRSAHADEKFTPHLRSCAESLRAANARALARHRSRYAIRACAASSFTFFRSFSTSNQ